jgi:hypothetical protein
MGQTVVGFFKDVSDVQKAVQRLENKGISNQLVDISKGKHLDGTVDPNGRNTNKITDFFNKLFGHDSDDARLYSSIGQQDVHILTVHARSGDMAETAADILDDCGALDVDEQGTRTPGNVGDRSGDSNRFSSQQEKSNQSVQPALQRDSSRSEQNSNPGQDRSLSYRDDYANTLSSENPVRDVNEPTNVNNDTPGDRGPGTFGANSDYVDERSYPVDRSGSSNDNRTKSNDTDRHMRNPIEESGFPNRSLGNMGAGSNDDFSRGGSRQAGYNNESGTRGSGAAFSGEDMTNDGFSSPDDDQRTINQNNPGQERSNMISDDEPGGLETSIPSPQEQLYRAKRRSRIINASVDDNYRLRE